MRPKIRRGVVRLACAVRPIRRTLGALRRRGGPPTQIHLVYPSDPTRAVGVLWQAEAATSWSGLAVRRPGEIAWRQEPASCTPAPGPRGFYQHGEVGGLEPDIAYEYRVSNDVRDPDCWSQTFGVRTAPTGHDAPVHAAFFADSAVGARRDGRSDAAVRLVAELANDEPSVVLGGGDYAYASSDQRFLDPSRAVDAWLDQMSPVFARSLFLPAFGNHESHVGERLSDWLPRVRLPASRIGHTYSFEFGPVHFVSLHAPGVVPSADHLEWLERDLQAARRRGAPWLVVYQHAPIFAHGSSHPARDDVRAALRPVLEANRVDLHLSAHDQSFERTAPLSGDRVEASRPGAEHNYTAGQGVVYAKVSPFGKLSDRGGDFSRLGTTLPDFVVARNDDCHHYALLRCSSDVLHVTVVGVPNAAGPRRVVDRFSIRRVSG